MPPGIEARDGSGKRKSHEQAEKPEDRAFDDARALLCALGIERDAPHRDAMTDMLHDEHSDEQSSGEQRVPTASCRPRSFTIRANAALIATLVSMPKLHS